MATMAEEIHASLQVERGQRSLAGLFQGNSDTCYRCKQSVFQAEKVGPVKEEVWHKACFRCTTCGIHLNMKNYRVNQTDMNDKEIYCDTHVTKTAPTNIGPDAVGIRRALTAPKQGLINEQIKGSDKFQINTDALFIQGALQSQLLQKNAFSNRFANKHSFPAVLVEKQQEIFRAQEELERLQREEEDRLYNAFQKERKKMEAELTNEIEDEWEERLKDLTAKFDSDMNIKGKKKKIKDSERQTLSSSYAKQKEALEMNMTVKRQKRKQNMTMKLMEKEQEKTSDLVKKHSAQMLELIQQKKIELQRELEEELQKHQAENGHDIQNGHNASSDEGAALVDEAAIANMMQTTTELPPPHPPSCKKADIYTDPSIFQELDEYVFSIAETDQKLWTDLVSLLTRYCISDLEKVRAIFRWLTVKDLNVLDMDDSDVVLSDDSPLSLLRGIKLGTETYHVLFMRLCSYAGVPCIEIKGHSKSVGYEPGMRVRTDTFQNTWNAVLIGGDWRLVQCNWGARHLVLNKDQKKQKQEKKTKTSDKIRYQYDEHYFLTDPEEFIQEFWPLDRDWQLLPNPINLDQFMDLPFVRSIFFHYGMHFEGHKHAVLYTDSKGGVEVKIRVPRQYLQDVVFHYQLRFAEREHRNDVEYKGAKLERFVFHSIVDDIALFSVHVPTMSDYFLEIFANKIDDSNKIGDDPNAQMMPFRLKCACKFKVVCTELLGKMHPLPNCASGEWGPWKSLRHFGITPLTNKTGVLNQDNGFELQFQLPRKLHFLTKLRANGVDDHILDSFVSHSVSGEVLTVRARMPQPGQYGLDIYARREDAADSHTLAHACKYLINCAHVKEAIELPVLKVDHAEKMTKDKWGPSAQFEKLGLKAVSHRDPKIHLRDNGDICIVIGVNSPVQITYHLIKEPDEDHRDNVNVVRDDKRAVKFFITLSKHGNYLFAIYARKESKDGSAGEGLINVYNYMIRYGIDDIKSPNKSAQLKKSFFRL